METFFQEYMPLLFCILGAAVILLFVFCIVLLLKINREKKRYDLFTGAKRRPPHNLETKIQEYYEHSKSIDEKYTKLLDMMTDIDKTTKQQIRKVGLVRYNPFEEMGGNLCFALALLDGEDNGVVLNGIHSRTGSFTYAKPIEMGVSTYMLSNEEKQAVKMAQDNAHEPQHEKIVRVRFKPVFKRRYAAAAEQKMTTKDVAENQKIPSLGDVTQAEQAQIQAEEEKAGKIAAADLEKLQEDLQAELKIGLHTEDFQGIQGFQEDARECEPKTEPKRRNQQTKNNVGDMAETEIPAPPIHENHKKQKKTLQEQVQEELSKQAEQRAETEIPAPPIHEKQKKQKKTLQEQVQEELSKQAEQRTETDAEIPPLPKSPENIWKEKMIAEWKKASEEMAAKTPAPEPETPALNNSEKAWKAHILEELEKAKAEKASMETSSPPPKAEKSWKDKIMEELEKAESEKAEAEQEASAEALQKDLQAELQSLFSPTEEKQ